MLIIIKTMAFKSLFYYYIPSNIFLCAVASTEYLQATWLPVQYASTTSQSMFDQMSALKNEGVRRVYVDVWNNGIVYFESESMRSIV